MTIDMVPVYVPLMRVLIVASALFAVLALGTSVTYSVAWRPDPASAHHLDALLFGAKIYAGVAVLFLGAALVVAGLPSLGLMDGLSIGSMR